MSIRVAILGAGIGAKHLAGFMGLGETFDVAAICDLDARRAAPLAEASGARIETDVQAVLDDPSIEIVDICLPPHLHFDIACRALRAGKHVICEKPMVTSLGEADELAKVVRETRRQVFPVFQYRFGPAADQLRALIAAGLAGNPLVATLETHWNRGAEYYAVPWRGTWAGERGGAVPGHAIHMHDFLSHILGPVDRVFAELTTRANLIETEDCAAITFRMASGVPATSSVTLGAARDETRMRFVFDRLTAESGRAPYTPAEDVWTFTARDPADQAEIDDIVAGVAPRPAGFAGLFDAVARALRGDGRDAVTIDDGQASLELVTAIYASARTDKPVHLPIQDNHPLYGGWLPS